jgi:hypothetical protein
MKTPARPGPGQCGIGFQSDAERNCFLIPPQRRRGRRGFLVFRPLNGKLKNAFLCELCASAVRDLVAAANRGILAFDPGLDDIGGASDPRAHGDCVGGAVFGAGTALHTSV